MLIAGGGRFGSGDEHVGYHGNTGLHRPDGASHRISVIFYLTKIVEPKQPEDNAAADSPQPTAAAVVVHAPLEDSLAKPEVLPPSPPAPQGAREVALAGTQLLARPADAALPATDAGELGE